ncbi:MAG: hypothetical protein K0S86_5965 [Geminicoccaceae bacterium]|nr:hypothetical protein [Geminicoccaceae bacterium]
MERSLYLVEIAAATWMTLLERGEPRLELIERVRHPRHLAKINGEAYGRIVLAAEQLSRVDDLMAQLPGHERRADVA